MPYSIQKQQNVKTVDKISFVEIPLTDLPLPADKLHIELWSTGDNTGQALKGSHPSLTLGTATSMLIKRVLWSKGNNDIKCNLFGIRGPNIGLLPLVGDLWEKRHVWHTYVGVTNYRKRNVRERRWHQKGTTILILYWSFWEFYPVLSINLTNCNNNNNHNRHFYCAFLWPSTAFCDVKISDLIQTHKHLKRLFNHLCVWILF